jgi:hypothetical protein
MSLENEDLWLYLAVELTRRMESKCEESSDAS